MNKHIAFLKEHSEQVRIAGLLNITYQAVLKWWRVGEVPAERVLAVCAARDWSVTPHQVRPDLYPHPHDGLPDHLRKAA